ncbi:MAG: hypothetical protein ACYDHZ_11620, partial [Dehalococcoidia bacterium]
IKGREIPVTAVLGGLITAVTWLIVVYTHHIGRIVGFTWVGIGLFVYFLYRRYKARQKKLQDADTLNRFKT